MGETYSDILEKDGYMCPYCFHYTHCDDWGHDYVEEIITCEDCSKKYYATAEVTVDFRSVPDCELNDETHNFKKFFNLDGYYCTICDKAITKNEYLKIINT